MIGNFEVTCGTKIEHFNNETPLRNYLKSLAGKSFTVRDKSGADITNQFVAPVKKEEPVKSSYTTKKKRSW